MHTTADRYAHLCRAYVQLSDRFQKLDVEHMTLKGKLLPLLKVVKSWKQTIATLKQEKAELETQLKVVSAKYEELKTFELLLQAAAQADLTEAEEQVKLVEQTIQELERDSAPDLSEAEKQLLLEFETASADFLSIDTTETNGSAVNPSRSAEPSSAEPSTDIPPEISLLLEQPATLY